MIIPIIPSDLDKSFPAVNTLSPSVFTQIKSGCQYKKMLHDSVIEKTKGMEVSLLFPPNPATLYGSIIHLLYEKRMKGIIPDGDAFEKAWENEVGKINRDLSQKYPMYFLNNDYDKMFTAKDVAMRMNPVLYNPENTTPQSEYTSQFERPYKIPGLLFGKIDRISIKGDTTEIIDYKTGKIYDDNGKIKQSYIYQLNLYALMYEYVEGIPVNKLTIIDKDGIEIDVPYLDDKEALKKEVEEVINNINSHINSGTAKDLAIPNEDNCKYCDCRHLCTIYWESPYLQNTFIKGKITDSGNKFVNLELDDGSSIRISGIEKLKVSPSEYYIGRHLMFLEVMPSQQTIGHYLVTKSTLVFEYSSTSDPYLAYYNNYLPELHTFVKVALEKGMDISVDGGFYITDDDDMIIAEAGLGIETKKIVVNVDSESRKVFEEKGYKVFSLNDIDEFTNYINI